MANIVIHVDTSRPGECRVSLGSPKTPTGNDKLAVSKMVQAIGEASQSGQLPKITKLDSSGSGTNSK